MDMSGVIRGLQAQAEATNGQTEGDYVGEDGLLYCGQCHTPKQCRVRLPLDGRWTMMTVPIPCQCRQAEVEAAERRKQAEERDIAIDRLYGASLISERDKTKTFASSEESDQMAICKGYAKRFAQMLDSGQGLLLWGKAGTGKTHAALCIANALLQDCVSVLLVSVPEILRGDGQELFERIKRVRLLILDDLGAERGTEYASERVYDLIDTRYRAGLPMVCTSNLDVAEMQATSDIRQRRICERILEVCYPLRFNSPRRRDIAQQRYAAMQDILAEQKSKQKPSDSVF